MSIEKASKLADYFITTKQTPMRWTWGQGLVGFALAQLDEYNGTGKYTPFLCDYCDYYAKNIPSVNSSDTSSPALITYAMYKLTHKAEYRALTDLVLDYIKNEPRALEGAVNHAGHSPMNKFYPDSLWVDSLMMFGVFPSLYAKENVDSALMDIAKIQCPLFAKYLLDKNDNLWYHSYWIKQAKPFPQRKLYWGRGNAWVISAIPKILDNLENCEEKSQTIEILQKTSLALKACQRKDGSFSTLLLKKNSYRELSATALIAEGWLHSVRCGYLDESYLEPALKAYKAVDDAIISTESKTLLPEISGPTIPLQIFPYLGYLLVPKVPNLTYGIAAYVWASIEYDKYLKATTK